MRSACSPLLEGLERSCRILIPVQGAPQLTLLIPGSGARGKPRVFTEGCGPEKELSRCSASLAALPLLIAGRFLLHGERSRA